MKRIDIAHKSIYDSRGCSRVFDKTSKLVDSGYGLTDEAEKSCDTSGNAQDFHCDVSAANIEYLTLSKWLYTWKRGVKDDAELAWCREERAD